MLYYEEKYLDKLKYLIQLSNGEDWEILLIDLMDLINDRAQSSYSIKSIEDELLIYTLVVGYLEWNDIAKIAKLKTKEVSNSRDELLKNHSFRIYV